MLPLRRSAADAPGMASLIEMRSRVSDSAAAVLLACGVGGWALAACGSGRSPSATDRAFAACDSAQAVSVSDPAADVAVVRHGEAKAGKTHDQPGWVDVRRVRVAVVPAKWLCVDITGNRSVPVGVDAGFYASIAADEAGEVASLSLGAGGAAWAPPGAPETEPVMTRFRVQGRRARYAIKIGRAPAGANGMSFGSFRFTLYSAVNRAAQHRSTLLVDCVGGWHAYPLGRRVPAPALSTSSGSPCGA